MYEAELEGLNLLRNVIHIDARLFLQADLLPQQKEFDAWETV